ncbi:ParA family protein [Cysteiniphilum sp. JM-1]|uniref:ParA family protein n=1 Tax=Cysteiniphilum sp. JM-1 TaxID=2610891 RepID=UPI00124916C1|nr:ParA family protein [Cysteiniphilum sp. JM-1]
MHLKLAQLSEITGIKRHTLNARLNNLYNKNDLHRTAGNQILLTPEQSKNLIHDKLCFEEGKIIYIGNLKGGVGKTTLSFLLADTLSSIGIKTCMIDLDVQANLTNQFTTIPPNQPVFYDIIHGAKKVHECIVNIRTHLDLIPSSLKNSLIEKELALQSPKHYLTWFNKLCLKYLRSNYDVIIVDTPPSLTTLNSVFSLSLTDFDNIIIPVNPEEFSIMGVQMFLEDINDIRSSYEVKKDPSITIMMNRFFQNQKTNLEILLKMGNLFGQSLSESVIKDSAKLREMINEKLSISEVKKGKDVYETVRDLLVELNILARINED